MLPGLPYHVHDPARPRSGRCHAGGARRRCAIRRDRALRRQRTSRAWTPTKQAWKVENGYVEVVPNSGDLRTKETFGDVQLHVEWAAPAQVRGDSQNRGNSGIFLQGRYEVQVLDSFDNPTYRRRPGRRDLRSVAAAGERGAEARRVAVLRHRLRGAPLRRHAARRSRRSDRLPERRAAAQPQGTDGADRASRAGEATRRSRPKTRSSCRITSSRCAIATSGSAGSASTTRRGSSRHLAAFRTGQMHGRTVLMSYDS